MSKVRGGMLWVAVIGLAIMGSGAQPAPNDPLSAFVTVNQPTQVTALYANGNQVATKWQKVWRPMCGTPHDAMNRQELLRVAGVHELAMRAVVTEPEDDELNVAGGGSTAGAHITIKFVEAASVPPAASTALVAVKAYLEGLFSDPITVKIHVSFDALDPGVLGQTGSNYTNVSWSQSRAGLVSGMDANDTIQAWLPTSSTIPVRYNGDSASITNENRVFWTLANFRATVGSVTGSAADMVFNTNFMWDYDPSDGVNGYSFQDVVIHEVGHALGFTSGIDFRFNDIEAMDIFRFQRSDGSADYNPDSKSEWQKRPRLAAFDSPNGEHICDLTRGLEYRMCDGAPNQASHFSNKTPPIGLMDPALGPNFSHFPDFYSDADLNMFDAIGYDR